MNDDFDLEKVYDSEITTFKKEVNAILADDNVFYDSNGDLKVIPGGSFQGIEPIISERRSRIVWALKQLPLFLGLNDTTTLQRATDFDQNTLSAAIGVLNRLSLPENTGKKETQNK